MGVSVTVGAGVGAGVVGGWGGVRSAGGCARFHTELPDHFHAGIVQIPLGHPDGLEAMQQCNSFSIDIDTPITLFNRTKVPPLHATLA